MSHNHSHSKYLWKGWEWGLLLLTEDLWFTKRVRMIEAAIIRVTTATVLCVWHCYVTLADAFLEFNACTLKLWKHGPFFLLNLFCVHRHNHIVYCGQRDQKRQMVPVSLFLFCALWHDHRFPSPCHRWSFGVVLWEIFSYGKQDIILLVSNFYVFVLVFDSLYMHTCLQVLCDPLHIAGVIVVVLICLLKYSAVIQGAIQ